MPLSIILLLLSGAKLGSVFIQTRKLESTLRFGLISFVGFGLLFLVLGKLTNTLGFLSWKTLPLVLIFIFSNAIMEELWFRGLFLKAYEPLTGKPLAIVVTALVFGISHVFATYGLPGGKLVFLRFCLHLGICQRTRNVQG